MIISHTHKYIFIKSTKTAGTSIEAALSKFCGDDDVVTPLGDYEFNRNEKGEFIHQSMNAGDWHQHEDALTIKSKLPTDVWNEYFKFSIVRNPWDRVVSLFHWLCRNQLPPSKKLYHHLGVPFDEFKATRKLFAEFVNGDWKTNERFYIIDNGLCVDYAIRYEHLSDDLKEVCRRVGLPEIELPHLKAGLRNKKRHYSEYYDDDTRQIVEARNANDIKHFGYTFDRI